MNLMLFTLRQPLQRVSFFLRQIKKLRLIIQSLDCEFNSRLSFCRSSFRHYLTAQDIVFYRSAHLQTIQNARYDIINVLRLAVRVPCQIQNKRRRNMLVFVECALSAEILLILLEDRVFEDVCCAVLSCGCAIVVFLPYGSTPYNFRWVHHTLTSFSLCCIITSARSLLLPSGSSFAQSDTLRLRQKASSGTRACQSFVASASG